MGLLLCLIGIFGFWPVVSSDELLVVGDSLQFIPSLEVRRSPGLNQELTSFCGRIHIHGYTRPEHMHKSIKLKIDASTGATSDIDVCFHRNLSCAIGMCPHYQWKKVSNGSWIQTMIPFDHKILDVRIAGPSKVTLKVSTVQEWCMFRRVCLILGTVLLSWASPLSKSVVFYYFSAIFAWFIIAPLLVLFQIMKNLPTRLSSWVSSMVIVGFLVRYTPVLFQIILKAAKLDQGVDKAKAMVLYPTSYIIGVNLGVCAVEGLVFTQDGSIDISTSIFVSWSIWILAAILILQSSIDPLLAGGALIFVLVMSSMLKMITRLIFPSGEVQQFREIGKEPMPQHHEGTSEVSSPHSEIVTLVNNVKQLETELEETRSMVEVKESHILELESTMNQNKHLWGGTETVVEDIFRQRIGAEIEYLIYSRSIDKWKSQMQLMEEQEALAEEEAHDILNKLGQVETKVANVTNRVKDLEKECREINGTNKKSREIYGTIKKRACKTTSCFLILLVVLLTVVLLFMSQLLPESDIVVVVPT